MTRWRWLQLGLGVALVLLAGRWLAEFTTDRLWAGALGATAPHADIAALRLALAGAGFVGAAVWFVGNLLVVYRQIGSVQVPRRLGNLEIAEAVPRRYLLAGAVAIGLVLALALSHGAGEWWRLRALVESDVVVGTSDPVLDRDIGYYLFRLPWLRAAHGYGFVLVLVGLLVVSVLYGAIGALRWTERRLAATDLARGHLGLLLATLAVVLWWGYRLEPAELVGGPQSVPYDGILTAVRIPVARFLGVLALLAAAASVVWVWLARGLVPVGAWGVLLGSSFVGHYILPSAVAASRGPEATQDVVLTAAAGTMLGEAYGLFPDTVLVELAVPDAGFAARHRADLRDAPIWDPFVLAALLNRSARPAAPDPRSGDRFLEATLSAARRRDGRVEPVFLAVREPDTVARRRLTWGERHGEPHIVAEGAVAVHAGRAQNGLPLFVPDLAEPDSVVAGAVDLTLRQPAIWFAPGTTDFALVRPDAGPVAGIAAGPVWRRLALAWTLQAPRLLTDAGVTRRTLVVADRAVGARLGRYAPFARFGAAYPVVHDGQVVWVATGYVWSDTYPLSRPVLWRGDRVRYLRAGFLGTVNAHTGATALYLLPGADPLSTAWGKLLPDLIEPEGAIPAAVLGQLRYPAESFAAQVTVLVGAGRARVPEPFWWVGRSVRDTTARLRLRLVDEVQADPRMAAVFDGVVVDGRPHLTLLRYPEPYGFPGPSVLAQSFRRGAPDGAPVDGTVRVVPFADGALALQAFYADSGTLSQVAVGWRNVVGRGGTLAEALAAIRPERFESTVGAHPLDAAREWFRRLDAARAAGDWDAFGEAWEGLRGVLLPRSDTGRVPVAVPPGRG
ncbi:MAG: UPF0182 family protein [Gemmatimonadota bacterium]|nr:UPF0182 family protein [Gemmatimonadota bacterium]